MGVSINKNLAKLDFGEFEKWYNKHGKGYKSNAKEAYKSIGGTINEIKGTSKKNDN